MPSEMPEIVEGEIVPYDDNKPAPLNLFGSNDPDVVITQAANVARALAEVINRQDLYVTIRGKKYVKVEGWTLLGTMFGVFPNTVWTRKLEDGWEARVEARTLDGRLVGAAESMCSRSESRWRNADEYAVRSMAATRTTSKALRQPLGFVMPLAEFETTPAEEMIGVDEPSAEPKPAASGGKIPPEIQPTDEQRDELITLIRTLERISPDVDWTKRCREHAGVDWDMTTRTIAKGLIERLQAELKRLVDAGEVA